MSPQTIAMLIQRLDQLDDRVGDVHKEVKDVKVLATATNGRVREVELWRARIEGARAAVGWIPTVISSVTALVAVVVAVIAL